MGFFTIGGVELLEGMAGNNEPGAANYLSKRIAKGKPFCYTVIRQFNSVAFVALLAQVKPGKLCGEPRSGECVHMGASPFVISPRLFQGLTWNPTGNCALFLVGSGAEEGKGNSR